MATEIPTRSVTALRRSRLWLIVVPVALGGAAFAASWLWFQMGPVVRVSDTVDLGVVDRKTPVIAPLEIRNAGTQPLRVSQFETSCPLCIFVNRQVGGKFEPAGEATIEPGQAITLFVRIGVMGEIGQVYEPRVWFRTNDPRHPEVSVGYRGMVRGLIACYPAELAMGTVDAGTPVSRRVQLRDTGRGTPYRLNRTAITGYGTMRARVLEPETRNDPDAARLGQLVAEVEVAGTIPADESGQEPRLELYEVGDDQPLIVPIRCTIRPLYEVMPPVLTIPRMVNGTPDYTSRFVVRVAEKLTQGRAVRILDLPPHFFIDRPLAYDAVSAGYAATIRYDPLGGAIGGRSVVRVEVPTGSSAKIIDIPVTLWQP